MVIRAEAWIGVIKMNDDNGIRDTWTMDLNRSFLMALTGAARNGDIPFLERVGVPVDIVPRLKNLTVDELDFASRYRGTLMSVSVDIEAMQLCLQSATTKSSDEKLIDQAIQLGMRQPTLVKLTGISRREFDKRCVILGIDSKPRGRIAALSEHDEIAVYTAYQELKTKHTKTLPLLIEISQQTGASLDQVAVSLIDDQDIELS